MHLTMMMGRGHLGFCSSKADKLLSSFDKIILLICWNVYILQLGQILWHTIWRNNLLIFDKWTMMMVRGHHGFLFQQSRCATVILEAEYHLFRAEVASRKWRLQLISERNSTAEVHLNKSIYSYLWHLSNLKKNKFFTWTNQQSRCATVMFWSRVPSIQGCGGIKERKESSFDIWETNKWTINGQIKKAI